MSLPDDENPPVRETLIREAHAADVPALAALRYDFRSAQAPATEDRAPFVERCAAWMAERVQAGTGWRCWIAAGQAGRIDGQVWVELIAKMPNPVGEPERHAYL
jgi:hypothetical protein